MARTQASDPRRTRYSSGGEPAPLRKDISSNGSDGNSGNMPRRPCDRSASGHGPRRFPTCIGLRGIVAFVMLRLASGLADPAMLCADFLGVTCESEAMGGIHRLGKSVTTAPAGHDHRSFWSAPFATRRPVARGGLRPRYGDLHHDDDAVNGSAWEVRLTTRLNHRGDRRPIVIHGPDPSDDDVGDARDVRPVRHETEDFDVVGREAPCSDLSFADRHPTCDDECDVRPMCHRIADGAIADHVAPHALTHLREREPACAATLNSWGMHMFHHGVCPCGRGAVGWGDSIVGGDMDKRPLALWDRDAVLPDWEFAFCNPRLDLGTRGGYGAIGPQLGHSFVGGLFVWAVVLAATRAVTAAFSAAFCLACLGAALRPLSVRLFARRPRRSWAAAGLAIGRRRFRRRRCGRYVTAISLGTRPAFVDAVCPRSRRRRIRTKAAAVAICIFFLATFRYGEAEHPGPPVPTPSPHAQHQQLACQASRAEVVDASWNAVLNYPTPHRDGFRGATAPGHDDDDTERIPRNSPGLKLRIEAVNSTGWGPLKRRLDSTQAHAVLAQETWIQEHQVPSARRWAKRCGWTSLWTPAGVGKGGGASGGAAIFVRKDMGLRAPEVGSHVVADARAVMGIAEFPGHRPLVLVSLYLVDGAKLGAENSALLDRVANAVRSQGPEYMTVCGGDFQNPPEAIAKHAAVASMRARVAASCSARGTYRSSKAATNIDFFAISDRLGMAIDKVELQEGTGVKAHVPVQLLFKERPVGLHTLMIKRPSCLPMERLHGPLMPELDWSQVEAATETALQAARTSRDKAQVQRKLDEAFDAWAGMAEQDIARVTGAPIAKAGTRGKRPVLKWKPVLPSMKPKSKGEAKASLITWIRGAAQEARRVNADFDADTAHEISFDSPFRGNYLPYGGTFAAPVRGGYSAPSLPPPPPSCGYRGGQRDRVLVRAEQKEVVRDILEELADGRHRVEDRPELAALLERTSQLSRRVMGKLVGSETVDLSARTYLDGAIEQLMADLVTAEKDAERERDADDKASFRRWVLKDIRGGASNAHRATRLEEDAQPTTVVTPKGILSADPMEFLSAMRRKYCTLWRASQSPIEYDWRGRVAELPRLSVQELRSASTSFADKTASSYDGLHVKSYHLISDRGLTALATLYAAIETASRWPAAASLTTVTLIDKKAGGAPRHCELHFALSDLE